MVLQIPIIAVLVFPCGCQHKFQIQSVQQRICNRHCIRVTSVDIADQTPDTVIFCKCSRIFISEPLISEQQILGGNTLCKIQKQRNCYPRKVMFGDVFIKQHIQNYMSVHDILIAGSFAQIITIQFVQCPADMSRIVGGSSACSRL